MVDQTDDLHIWQRKRWKQLSSSSLHKHYSLAKISRGAAATTESSRSTKNLFPKRKYLISFSKVKAVWQCFSSFQDRSILDVCKLSKYLSFFSPKGGKFIESHLVWSTLSRVGGWDGETSFFDRHCRVFLGGNDRRSTRSNPVLILILPPRSSSIQFLYQQ